MVLLLSRFDIGRKAWLNFEQFSELVDSLALQSGGRPFNHMEHHVLWSRADFDHTGQLDLNKLFLHLRRPIPFAVRREQAAHESDHASVEATDNGATDDDKALTPRHAALRAEDERRVRVDALVERAAPTIAQAQGRGASFGTAEVRALGALFDDLDADRDGKLSLQEMQLLLTLVNEKSSTASSLEHSATAPHLGLREANTIFRNLDKDASGTLDFTEVSHAASCPATLRRRPVWPRPLPHHAWRHFPHPSYRTSLAQFLALLAADNEDAHTPCNGRRRQGDSGTAALGPPRAKGRASLKERRRKDARARGNITASTKGKAHVEHHADRGETVRVRRTQGVV